MPSGIDGRSFPVDRLTGRQTEILLFKNFSMLCNSTCNGFLDFFGMVNVVPIDLCLVKPGACWPARAWFLEIAFVRKVGMFACVCVCVCPPPKL